MTGYTLGGIESDPAIEITLTTILAYFSFIIAEHVFHVSGIMKADDGCRNGNGAENHIAQAVHSQFELECHDISQ